MQWRLNRISYYWYLLSKHQKIVLEMLNNIDDNNISIERKVDFVVSIHLVLEIWINDFFRSSILPKHLGHTINKQLIEVVNNFDKISFSDKIIALVGFITITTTNIFDIQNKNGINICENIGVIWNIKNFSKYRNLALHGSFLWSITLENNIKSSSSDFESMFLQEISKIDLKVHFHEFSKIIFSVSTLWWVFFYRERFESTHIGKTIKKFWFDTSLEEKILECGLSKT